MSRSELPLSYFLIMLFLNERTLDTFKRCVCSLIAELVKLSFFAVCKTL